MDRDTEQLKLLAIFHYVVAGLAALFSFFPLLYSVIGGFLLYAAQRPGPSNQEPPPAFLGWIFIVLGAVFFRRRHHGDLHSDCWSMPFPSQKLLVRTRDGLHRMPVRSVRNNSGNLYDRCTFARVSEGIVLWCTKTSTAVASSCPTRAL